MSRTIPNFSDGCAGATSSPSSACIDATVAWSTRWPYGSWATPSSPAKFCRTPSCARGTGEKPTTPHGAGWRGGSWASRATARSISCGAARIRRGAENNSASRGNKGKRRALTRKRSPHATRDHRSAGYALGSAAADDRARVLRRPDASRDRARAGTAPGDRQEPDARGHGSPPPGAGTVVRTDSREHSDAVTDNHTPIADQLAAYVLDSLEPHERDRVEHHVASCAVCA